MWENIEYSILYASCGMMRGCVCEHNFFYRSDREFGHKINGSVLTMMSVHVAFHHHLYERLFSATPKCKLARTLKCYCLNIVRSPHPRTRRVTSVRPLLLVQCVQMDNRYHAPQFSRHRTFTPSHVDDDNENTIGAYRTLESVVCGKHRKNMAIHSTLYRIEF